MRNIKLTLAYDGADFIGWQMQPGQASVQGHLRGALRQITQEEMVVHGAGRTDAGVHAQGQVANFKTESRLAPAEFQRALNALLPPAIRVHEATEVSAEFHARHAAVAKTYAYRIFRGRVVPPHLWRYVLHHAGPLEEEQMMAAARLFVGEHDFTCFSAAADIAEEEESAGRKAPSPIRTIYSATVERVTAPPFLSAAGATAGREATCGESELVFRVRGRSFLRHMVRKMAGTLLDVGRGRFTPEDIPRLLASRDRAQGGPTAPAHGLVLESVEYPVAGT
jgi:tRNA pseudouridine38-40 synthase